MTYSYVGNGCGELGGRGHVESGGRASKTPLSSCLAYALLPKGSRPVDAAEGQVYRERVAHDQLQLQLSNADRKIIAAVVDRRLAEAARSICKESQRGFDDVREVFAAAEAHAHKAGADAATMLLDFCQCSHLR